MSIGVTTAQWPCRVPSARLLPGSGVRGRMVAKSYEMMVTPAEKAVSE